LHRRAAVELWPPFPQTTPVKCAHTAPAGFTPGQALALSLAVSGGEGVQAVRAARLRYRHVNQAERWSAADASGENGAYSAAIPAEYTAGEFPLEYYFELEDKTGLAWMHPGFNRTLSNQPYFVVEKRKS